LNADKSEAIIRTGPQLRSINADSVTVAESLLLVADDLKSLGFVLDSRLTFDR
jgi:hypothetical protein